MKVKEFTDYEKACAFRGKVGGQTQHTSYKGKPLYYVWYEPKENKNETQTTKTL